MSGRFLLELCGRAQPEALEESRAGGESRRLSRLSVAMGGEGGGGVEREGK